MAKFSEMSGFGNEQSAKANINRLLRKLAGEQWTSGAVSPVKNGEGEDAAPITPASKKKSGGCKRKTGECAINVLGFPSARSRTNQRHRSCCGRRR